MLSTAVKMKNFSYFTTNISRTEFLPGFSSVTKFRTLFTTVTSSFSKILPDVNESLIDQKVTPNKKDLGKIVVLDSEDVELCSEGNKNDTKTKKNKKLNKIEPKSRSINLEDYDEAVDDSKNETNTTSKLKYTTDEKSPHLLRSVFPALKTSKLREKRQQILIEGKRLIYDAVSAGYFPDLVFFSRLSDVAELNLPSKTKLCKASYKSLSLWSDVVTSQGVIAVFKTPDLTSQSSVSSKSSNLPLTVICDNIREPGNMGSILRVCAGVGCEKVMITKGCVDIWAPKVIRAAAGAHFHLNISRNLQWDEIENMVSEESKIVLADSENTVLEEENEQQNKKESIFKNKSEISNKIPLLSYDSMKFKNNSVVVVIGGETYGLNEKAYELAVKRDGVRVFIPMANGLDSLNSGVALGILSYNIRLNLIEKNNNKCNNKELSNSPSKEAVTFTEEQIMHGFYV